ncbi:major facilitator superfamily domain-containing protein [Lasiosphaeria hispida]|uniref:Major facilitator superfamily domain-containing protein n=1 Tax=Lasiosphaeria hispida TaxID=260671 RepID=A0AAJ0HTN2_9PEZI|nr:major facilitator superfamily domain-containing protein [Lasiosphaeria hispida]
MVNRKNGRPKLPAQQLAILAIARFAEPLALTSVFPYLPEMIRSFGVENNDVARWAGFTGAVFSICQSITAVPWGRASDKFGRKPVILFGLASTMCCFLLWGMSTSLAMAITARAIMGGGNGNVGIIRTMVAELVPERELQPQAFSIMPLVWSIGSVFGPAFGGFFAQPAKHYPGLFGNIEFFKTYPFALPNLIACAVFFVSFMTGLLFLHETLETKRHKPDWGLALGEKLTRPFQSFKERKHRRRSFVDDEASAPLLASRNHKPTIVDTSRPSMKEIFTNQTVVNLVSYTFLALHSVAYDQVLPVFLNYPRQIPDDTNTHLPFQFSGGFGLESDKIGTIYTIYGITCGVIQFFLFPVLCARFGVLNCFKVATMVFPLVYLLTPYTALIQDDVLRFAALLVLMFVKGIVVIVGFPCTTIMLTNSASSVRILGTLNGFATAFSGIGRAVGPAVAGAVFSIGVQRGYMIAPWWLLGSISALGAIPAWFIVEGDGPMRSSDTDSEDEEEETLVANDGDVAVLEGMPGSRVSDSDDEAESLFSERGNGSGAGYGTTDSKKTVKARN